MQADKWIFYSCVALITIGIVFSLSLPVFTVLFFNYEPYHFFIRQLVVGAIGIFLMWGISRLDPDKSMVWIGFCLFGFCAIAMGAMHALPRSFARKIDGSKKSLKQEFKLILPYMFLFLIAVYLIAILQNDLGQVVVLALTLIVMMLFAGTSKRLFVIGMAGASVLAFVAIFTSEHRILRIKSWWGTVQNMVLSLMPESMANMFRVEGVPEPYQISHSLNAIKHGGFFGEGLGAGVFKLGFLSEVHTDFVLAGIAEEVGVLGILIITSLLLILLFRIFRVSSRSENKVYHLFTLGVGLLISFSFIMNSYGITSITPIKGIAVPFLSYGGSSILALCIGVGMVLMVSKKVKD